MFSVIRWELHLWIMNSISVGSGLTLRLRRLLFVKYHNIRKLNPHAAIHLSTTIGCDRPVLFLKTPVDTISEHGHGLVMIKIYDSHRKTKQTYFIYRFCKLILGVFRHISRSGFYGLLYRLQNRKPCVWNANLINTKKDYINKQLRKEGSLYYTVWCL